MVLKTLATMKFFQVYPIFNIKPLTHSIATLNIHFLSVGFPSQQFYCGQMKNKTYTEKKMSLYSSTLIVAYLLFDFDMKCASKSRRVHYSSSFYYICSSLCIFLCAINCTSGIIEHLLIVVWFIASKTSIFRWKLIISTHFNCETIHSSIARIRCAKFFHLISPDCIPEFEHGFILHRALRYQSIVLFTACLLTLFVFLPLEI